MNRFRENFSKRGDFFVNLWYTEKNNTENCAMRVGRCV